MSLLAQDKNILCDAEWLGGERVRVYLRILAATEVLALIALALSLHDGIDPRGEPLGPDFVSFWTAARMALAGAAAKVYDPAAHLAAERAFFGENLGWYAFFYPPVFLLYLLPFGLASWFWALVLWLAATLAACLALLRAIAAKSFGLAPLLLFPAVFVNLVNGQNAFLTTALFSGGALLLTSRPFCAGMILGALIYKPQLAVLVPLTLVFCGRGRAVAGFLASAAALVCLSLLAFGAETWRAFFAASVFARQTLEHNLVEPAKLQSLFAAVRLWGGPLWLAYAAQAAMAAGALAVLAARLRRTQDAQLQMALTALAAPLATPFVLDYDLVLLALPLAVSLKAGLDRGFLPYEKSALLAAFMLPIFARPLALHTFVPLSPLALALFLASLARRAEAQ